MPRIRSCLIIAALASPLGHAGAGELVLVSSRDNTLYEDNLGLLSNGAGDHCFAGVTAEPGLRRALVRFDVSGGLPSGATIVEATLTMHMSQSIAGPTDVTLHRVLADWGEGASHAARGEGAGAPAEEGDATWIHTSFDTSLWANPGGDFDPTVSASTEVGDIGFYEWSSDRMAAEVGSWIEGSRDNFGWMLIGDESVPVTAKRFDTHENPVAEQRPMLRIVYRPACTADWNSDGVVNTQDFLAYLNEWVTGSAAADLNDDDTVNTQDFLAFLNAWTAGC